MNQPRKKDFGFSPKRNNYDTVGYLQALEKWEKDLNAAIKKAVQAQTKINQVKKAKPRPGGFEFQPNPVEWNEQGYQKAMEEWEARNTGQGRQRRRQIHLSWAEYLAKFQPVPGRSQGAFCAWAGMNRSTFSAMQTKPIPMHIVELIGAWLAQGKEVGINNSLDNMISIVDKMNAIIDRHNAKQNE